MSAQTAASPGVAAGNLAKRIALLRLVEQECTISGVRSPLLGPRTLELYREKLLEQIEWLHDELAVNESQLELALFPVPAT